MSLNKLRGDGEHTIQQKLTCSDVRSFVLDLNLADDQDLGREWPLQTLDEEPDTDDDDHYHEANMFPGDLDITADDYVIVRKELDTELATIEADAANAEDKTAR